MKKSMLLLMALIVFTFSTAHAENSNYNDFNTDIGESGYSPVVHFTIGGVTSGLVYHYIPDHWELNKFTKSVIGVGAAVLVGFAIELADDEIDGRDIADYATAGVITVTIFSISF